MKLKKILFLKTLQRLIKFYHEVVLLKKFLQTKPQAKNMNINFYDLYYTVIKTRDKNKNIENQYENDKNIFINFNDIVPNLPNHYVEIKKNNEILK